MRRVFILAVAILAAILLSGCGGSGSTTLHGTFSDDGDVTSGNMSCSDAEDAGAITVAVDNVPAGSATLNWQGNPQSLPTLGGSTVYACTGTWTITVPTAHISYVLGISGLGGETGTVTIPVSQAGQAIPLDDYPQNGNGGGSLEVSS
jgi:hypothetical protein